jgi:hypothetical protein
MQPQRTRGVIMADFQYVTCQKCQQRFMVGVEFFRLPDAYCCCPYCHHEFPVGVAAQRASTAPSAPVGA